MRGYACVLVTRPEEDATGLAAAITQRGASVRIEPMLAVAAIDGPEPDLDDVQAVLITSANGLRALARRTPRRALTILAVGAASAAAARAAGFADVVAAGGDVAALAALVMQRCRPERGRLFHAAGSVTAGDLAGRLRALGYQVERQTLYATETARHFTQETAAALYAGAIDAVAFFSPRTGETFARLARRSGVDGRLAGCDALCLSAPVGNTVRALAWHEVRVAPRPDQAALLDLIAPLPGPAAVVS